RTLKQVQACPVFHSFTGVASGAITGRGTAPFPSGARVRPAKPPCSGLGAAVRAIAGLLMPSMRPYVPLALVLVFACAAEKSTPQGPALTPPPAAIPAAE